MKKEGEHNGKFYTIIVNKKTEEYQRYNPSDHEHYPATRYVWEIIGNISGRAESTRTEIKDESKVLHAALEMEKVIKEQINPMKPPKPSLEQVLKEHGFDH